MKNVQTGKVSTAMLSAASRMPNGPDASGLIVENP